MKNKFVNSLISVVALSSVCFAAHAAIVGHNCNVSQVMSAVGDSTNPRIHIRCDQPYTANPSIVYFALPDRTATEMQGANQAVSIGMAAMTTNKKINITFDDADLSGQSFGCGSSDCRKIISITLLK